MTDPLATAKKALELSEKAAAGPWAYVATIGGAINAVTVWSTGRVIVEAGAADIDKNNALFTAFARTALPELAQEVLRLDEATFDAVKVGQFAAEMQMNLDAAKAKLTVAVRALKEYAVDKDNWETAFAALKEIGQ